VNLGHTQILPKPYQTDPDRLQTIDDRLAGVVRWGWARNEYGRVAHI
jgi:hypothetical protein